MAWRSKQTGEEAVESADSIETGRGMRLKLSKNDTTLLQMYTVQSGIAPSSNRPRSLHVAVENGQRWTTANDGDGGVRQKRQSRPRVSTYPR